MLGSGKTPVGSSREEKRTVEPDRRLGKRASKTRSLLLLLSSTDIKCAIVTQQSEQILKKKRKEQHLVALKHHLHLKNCKRRHGVLAEGVMRAPVSADQLPNF